MPDAREDPLAAYLALAERERLSPVAAAAHLAPRGQRQAFRQRLEAALLDAVAAGAAVPTWAADAERLTYLAVDRPTPLSRRMPSGAALARLALAALDGAAPGAPVAAERLWSACVLGPDGTRQGALAVRGQDALASLVTAQGPALLIWTEPDGAPARARDPLQALARRLRTLADGPDAAQRTLAALLAALADLTGYGVSIVWDGATIRIGAHVAPGARDLQEALDRVNAWARRVRPMCWRPDAGAVAVWFRTGLGTRLLELPALALDRGVALIPPTPAPSAHRRAACHALLAQAPAVL